MKIITTPEDVKQLGTILCVGAHPDDETWIAGGVLAAAAENGQKVLVLTATKGEAGSLDETRWPLEDIGLIRARELHAALQELGVTEHGLLDCEDGKCDQVNAQEMALRLAGFIHNEKPDTILTFGPEGLTGHTDHASVSRWCELACALVDTKPRMYHAVHTPQWYEDYGRDLHEKGNVFYNIDQPPLVEESELAIDFKLPKAIADKKLKALQAQPSQMEALLAKFPAGELPKALAHECFISTSQSY